MNVIFNFIGQLPEPVITYASDAVEFASNNPYIGIGVAIAAISMAGRYYFTSSNNSSDEAAIRKLAKEIVELKPTIGDAGSYDFAATYGAYVNPLNTKAGSQSMTAIVMQAKQAGFKYGERGQDVVALGERLLKDKSGQCDHMAAAVIAKVVEHIRQGNAWDSTLELVGNGAHAFVIMNREGELSDPTTWGKKAMIIDTWLGRLGVNETHQGRLTAGESGVVSGAEAIRMNARVFGAHRFKVTHTFTPQELKDLAKQ